MNTTRENPSLYEGLALLLGCSFSAAPVREVMSTMEELDHHPFGLDLPKGRTTEDRAARIFYLHADITEAGRAALLTVLRQVLPVCRNSVSRLREIRVPVDSRGEPCNIAFEVWCPHGVFVVGGFGETGEAGEAAHNLRSVFALIAAIVGCSSPTTTLRFVEE